MIVAGHKKASCDMLLLAEEKIEYEDGTNEWKSFK